MYNVSEISLEPHTTCIKMYGNLPTTLLLRDPPMTARPDHTQLFGAGIVEKLNEQYQKNTMLIMVDKPLP